jgi:hypothetical protein
MSPASELTTFDAPNDAGRSRALPTGVVGSREGSWTRLSALLTGAAAFGRLRVELRLLVLNSDIRDLDDLPSLMLRPIPSQRVATRATAVNAGVFANGYACWLNTPSCKHVRSMMRCRLSHLINTGVDCELPHQLVWQGGLMCIQYDRHQISIVSVQ